MVEHPADDAVPTRPRGGRRGAQLARDVAAVLVSLLGGFALFGAGLESSTATEPWLRELDLLAGLVMCVAVWWRRRWPLGLALAGAVPAAFSDFAGVAVTVAIFTCAVHRPWKDLVPVVGLHWVGVLAYLRVRPDPTTPLVLSFLFGTVLLAAVIAWGMYVRARRQLVESLRERAERAESEQAARVAQAREGERSRIAREMHDVLAHRISLVSMHAGALEYRADAPAAEVAAAAGVIRANAHEALEDLRQVIGVLRSGPEESAGRPLPVLADLPALVADARAAGGRVEATVEVDDVAAVPAVSGRTAYRVVQEGLTNARKHAPGALVRVAVQGRPGDGLHVTVSNPRGVAAGTVVPGAGTGLVGLTERAVLAGGRLEHRTDADGTFHLCADLPWPAP